MSFNVDNARDVLLEERVYKLHEISERRKEMLQEMFYLIQIRNGVEMGLKSNEQGDEPLNIFLDKFNIEKNLDTGSILNFKLPDFPDPTPVSPSAEHSKSHDVSADTSYEGLFNNTSESELSYKQQIDDVPEDADILLEDPEVLIDDISDHSHDLLGEKGDEPERMDIDEDAQRSESWVDVNDEDVELEDEDIETRSEDVAPALVDHEDREDASFSSEKGTIPGTRSSPITVPDDDHDELDIISLSSAEQLPSPPTKRKRQAARRTIHTDSETDETEDETDEPKDQDSNDVKQGSMEGQLSNEEEIRPDLFRPPSPSPVPSSPPPQTPSPPEPSSTVNEHDIAKVYALLMELPPTRVDDLNNYTFNDEPPTLNAPPIVPQPAPPFQRIIKSAQVTLPPLSVLPLEFNKKGKIKQRRRDKEKDKSGSESGKKDEWVPISITRWFATLRTNPVHKKVSRAVKCLSTRDWNTALMELQFVRTCERVETLKDEGRWSFRQPKKQRGMGGLTKTHWDYLMDEMKWLQVDFREERKWKIAIALELAIAVLEWHQAGSSEERVRLGICTLWRKPPDDTVHTMTVDIDEVPKDLQDISETFDDQQDSVEIIDADDQPMSEDGSMADVDPLHPTNIMNDALDSETPAADAERLLSPKVEDIESFAALGDVVDANDGVDMEVDHPVEDLHNSELSQIIQDRTGLTKASNNPMLSEPLESAPTIVKDEVQNNNNIFVERNAAALEQIQILREPIINLSESSFFAEIDLEQFRNALNISETDLDIEPELQSVFPELQPYSLLDIAALETVDAKRKVDRKADKDDPFKRLEETTYNKLYPANKFMQVKPILISALQPSRKWHDGAWHSLDESPVIADLDSFSSLSGEENSSSLFDNRRQLGMIQPHAFLQIPHRDRKRSEVSWSPAEDALLKQLVDKYFTNWRLIADAFNSSRMTVSNDKRTALDCLERWVQRWGSAGRTASMNGASETPAQLQNAAESTPMAVPAGPSHGATMTTRGIKRLANSSTTTNTNNNGLAISTSSNTTESRKRRRHALIHEAMRKISKKREASAKSNSLNNGKPSGRVHDTHQPFQQKVKYTPQELSRMKADADASELIAQQQRRQEEMRRQAKEHAARLQMQPQTQQIAQQNNLLPVQNVPQIRSSQVNISQQQQQRHATATPALQGAISGNTIPSHLVLQAQQAQARALAHLAQAQPQTQIPAQNQASQASLPARLSPSFSNQIPISPGLQSTSPPRPNSMHGRGSSSPRPPSAQRNVSMVGAPGASGPATHIQIPGNPIARQSTNLPAAYFPGGQLGVQVSQEQLQAFRLQMLSQQQQQIQQAQQNQMNANIPVQVMQNHQMTNNPYPQHGNSGG